MSTSEARAVNDLVDAIAKGYCPNAEELDHLRSFLPARPKQVTLEQLRDRVHDAWMNALGNERILEDMDLDEWLLALRDDLIRIINAQNTPDAGEVVVGAPAWVDADDRSEYVEKPKPPTPALPEGIRVAYHEEYGRVVVSPKSDSSGVCDVLYIDSSSVTGSAFNWAHECELTLIDTEPLHPEFLETKEDYDNAPVGTVVAEDGSMTPRVKNYSWPIAMTHTRRRVLRWGDS